MICSVMLLTHLLTAAAQEPVQWRYTAQKVGDQTYLIQIKAIIAHGWHIYAHKQPRNFIGTPTLITFAKNPLVAPGGAVKEEGKLETVKEPTLGVEQNCYSDSVIFVQSVKLKKRVRTRLNGTIVYQACTNESCLSPATVAFRVDLE